MTEVAMKDHWSVPRAHGEHLDGRFQLTWWPAPKQTNKALFELDTNDRRATLLYIARITTRQRGETRTKRDTNPSLDDIPNALLTMMEKRGITPVEEVSRWS